MAAESHQQEHGGSLPACRGPGATGGALSLPTSPLCSCCQTPSPQISPASLTCPPPAAAAALVEVERRQRHHLLRLHSVERVEVVVLPHLTQSVHVLHPLTQPQFPHHSPLFIQIPDPSCGSTPAPLPLHTHTTSPPPHPPVPSAFFLPPSQ